MLEKFLKHIEGKKKSENNYILLNYALKKVQDGAGKDLDTLTYEDVQVVISGLKLGDSSIEAIQRKLVQYYTWMFNETDDPKWHKMVRQIKSGKIDKPKSKINPQDLVSPEEVKRLINVATIERDRAIIAVLFESGMRIGELVSLKNSMVVIDDAKKEIKFHIPNEPGCKTGARTVTCIEIYPHVVSWMKCNNSDRFIPISDKQIRNIFINIYKKAGINKKCNPHMLRHSAITYMATLHASETELSYRFWGVPHSTMVTTYIHLSNQQQSDGYRNIKGMGESKNVAVNPLASKCVQCGDHIINGSLCPKCEQIKTLLENQKIDKAEMEASKAKIEALTTGLMTLSKIIQDNELDIFDKGRIRALIKNRPEHDVNDK